MRIDLRVDARAALAQYLDDVGSRLTPARNDLLLVGVIFVICVLELVLNADIEPRWAAIAIDLVVVTALAWRRRFPLAVTCIASCGIALESIAGVPVQAPIIPLLAVVVAVYSLVVHAPTNRLLLGLVIVGVGMAVAVTSQNKGVGNFLFGALWVGGAVFVGRLVRPHHDAARELEERAARLEREREAHMRIAVEEERRRIARELHDVIAHSLSVIVVQAGAAEEMLRVDPERARAPVHSIQETGRDALAEMSRLLGVLREDGAELGLIPQPGLSDLRQLLEEAEVAGVLVQLSVEGEQRALPPGVELSAYRVVQEALTNARRHGGRAQTTVTLRYGDDALDVTVVDDGGDSGRAATSGEHRSGGLGLVGMRERVTLYGGSLAAGPRPGGGFAVEAHFPLSAPA